MLKFLIIILTLLVTTQSVADEPIGSGIDCTDVQVNYWDNPDLTTDEKLSLMDRALFDSLNKFELCNQQKDSQSASSSSGGSSGGGATGTGSGSGGMSGDGNAQNPDGNEEGYTESVASSGMSGTETPTAPTPASNVQTVGDQTGTATATAMEETDEPGSHNNNQLDNGKLPDDIPPAANDDAVAAQIKYAAENETDPKTKAQLWNEYRKYKGLPTKE